MPPTKILVVRPDAIGDVVLMIPLLNTIKAAIPDAYVTVLLQSYTQGLLDNHPACDDILLDWKKAGKANGIAGFKAYAQHIRDQKFDAVLFPYMGDYHVWLAFAAGIPVRIGDGNKIPLRWLLTHPINLRYRNITRHETEQNIRLVEGLVKAFTPDLTMNLFFSEEEGAEARAILSENDWMPDQKLICIHPTTGGGNRAWLPEKYTELIQLIYKNTNYQVILTGFGAKDEEVIRTITGGIQGAKQPICIAGKTTLHQLAAVLNLCEVVVGTDTGPTHMAAALKRPVLCISPTKFVKSLRWGPWQTANKIEGNPGPCPLVCNPYKCRETYCLTALLADDVFASLQRLLAQDPATVTYDAQKLEWFRASINVAYYVSAAGSEIDDLKRYLSLASERNIRPYIICETPAIEVTIRSTVALRDPDRVLTIPAISIAKMLRFVTTKDIGLIHLLPAKKTSYWWTIRQLAGPSIYCPPVIVRSQIYATSSDAFVRTYLDQFEKLEG